MTDALRPFAALLAAAESGRLPSPVRTTRAWEAGQSAGWFRRNPLIANANEAAISWAGIIRCYPDSDGARRAERLLWRLCEVFEIQEGRGA